ncbi:MAG TPA: ATP-binding cassette domain-containing protein [Conexibacter sp.]|nr:ATP-binding cassette domain-containing protein [Conexibacter sp.]
MSKTYWRGAHEIPVLKEVSLELRAGELVAVRGGRHTGKTTLLRIAAGLTAPDAGVVRFDGADLQQLSDAAYAELLSERLGWARCGEGPSSNMRALDFVAVPLLVRHGRGTAERHAADALALVGAERCHNTTWDRLSDLERTLVTLARALGRQPALLLVDDATVGLGDEERERVVGLLRTQAEGAGLGVLMTAVEKQATRQAHRVGSLRDGRLVAPPEPPANGGQVIRLPPRR